MDEGPSWGLLKPTLSKSIFLRAPAKSIQGFLVIDLALKNFHWIGHGPKLGGFPSQPSPTWPDTQTHKEICGYRSGLYNSHWIGEKSKLGCFPTQSFPTWPDTQTHKEIFGYRSGPVRLPLDWAKIQVGRLSNPILSNMARFPNPQRNLWL